MSKAKQGRAAIRAELMCELLADVSSPQQQGIIVWNAAQACKVANVAYGTEEIRKAIEVGLMAFEQHRLRRKRKGAA